MTEPPIIPFLITHLQRLKPNRRAAQVSFFQRIEHTLNFKEPASLQYQAINALVKKCSTEEQDLSSIPLELREQIIIQEQLMNEYFSDFLWCLKRGSNGVYRESDNSCMFDILNDFAGREKTSFYFLETLRLVKQLNKEWFDRGFSYYGHVSHTVGEELLTKSVESGNPTFVEWLLKFGVNPNYSDGYGSMIERAIRINRPDIIKILVSNGASIAKQNPYNYRSKSSLWKACAQDKHQCAALLISLGADVNELDDQKNQSILMATIKNGHEKCVNALLQNGARVDLQDSNGRTALFYAVDSYYNRTDCQSFCLSIMLRLMREIYSCKLHSCVQVKKEI